MRDICHVWHGFDASVLRSCKEHHFADPYCWHDTRILEKASHGYMPTYGSIILIETK